MNNASVSIRAGMFIFFGSSIINQSSVVLIRGCVCFCEEEEKEKEKEKETGSALLREPSKTNTDSTAKVSVLL